VTDPGRIALYLRAIAGEIAAATGNLPLDKEHEETLSILDTVNFKLLLSPNRWKRPRPR
jgi:hypothetical protein